jgi:hypothetical protein
MIGAVLAGALPMLRAQAESAMLDTCTVRPVTGVDESTGAPTLGTAVYTGKCKVQTSQAQEANPEAGGAVYTVQRYAGHVPVDAFVPAVGHVVTITAASLDAGLVGRQYRVVALLHKTLATAYRLAVTEVI